MIAEIRMTDGRTATLEDDGTWHAEDEMLAKVLNVAFSPIVNESGPAAGIYGYREVQQVANRFGASYTLAPQPQEDDPDRVY